MGVDRHPYFYYRAKSQAEGVVERSGLPYTILRTIRFHDLVPLALRASARLPVPLPGRVFAAFRRGVHLTPERREGRKTFEEFLGQ